MDQIEQLLSKIDAQTYHLLDYKVIALVFMASFLGSTHCLVMCGPICSNFNKSSIDNIKYNIGRGLSYIIIGSTLGGVGYSIKLLSYKWLSLSFLIILLFATLLSLCIHIWPKIFKPSHTLTSSLNSFLFQNLKIQRLRSKYLLGLFTPLIPCGWLYTFFLFSASTQSAIHGALIMMFFWLGSLPAMTVAPALLKGLYLRLPKWRFVSQCLICVFCVYSISAQAYKTLSTSSNSSADTQPNTKPSCH